MKSIPLGVPAALRRRRAVKARWCCCSRTSTGRSRRCSTSWTTSHAQLLDAPVLLLCLARPELLAARPAWADRDDGAPRTAQRRREPAAAGRPQRPVGVAAHGGRSPGRRQPALPRAAGGARDRATPGRRPSRPRCTRCWPPVSTCSPPRSGRCSTPPPSRVSTSTSAASWRSWTSSRPWTAAAAWTRWSRVSCCCPRRPRSPASRPGGSATRWSETPPTSRPRSPRERAGTSASRTGSRASGRASPRPTHGSAPTSSGRTAPPSSSDAQGRSCEALATRAARHLTEAGSRAHLRGDLPSEIAFLSRAAALLGPDDPARAELLPAVAVALFEAGSLDRAATVADDALAVGERLGLARVRWRAAVERERLHVFRNPEAVEPDASLAVIRRAVTALGALDDDLGLARAYFVASELVWLKGSAEMRLPQRESGWCTTPGAPAAASRSRRPSATWRGRSSSTRSRSPTGSASASACSAR